MIIVAKYKEDIFNFDKANGIALRCALDSDRYYIKIWGRDWDKILGTYDDYGQAMKIIRDISGAYKRGARVYYMPGYGEEGEENDT